MTRWLRGSPAMPSILSVIDHVCSTVPAVVYSISVLLPPPPTLSVLFWQPRKRWPSRNARSSQCEAGAAGGVAIFVIENPAATDGAGPDAAKAPAAELMETTRTPARTVGSDGRPGRRRL